ncbi:MAG: electron transfer flavoprotein subunit beta/FixA family protein [Deltaproteobacteria bacterium]|nr:electron transfer flavoprotein subunit beta/FixA family protein [Deltaproteobacteria bacterium]
MKLLACVKQILDFEAAVPRDTRAHAITPGGTTPTKVNPFDLFAVEECLRLKDTIPATTVDVVSVGPNRAADALRKALGMGADRGIHISTTGEAEPSPFTVACRIASYARKASYDLIVTGMMTEDGMHAQVGPIIAEMLSRPCAIAAVVLDPSIEKKRVYVEKEVEGGMRIEAELELPAVVAVQIGVGKPRYPSLSNILRAKNQELEIVDAGSFEQPAPRDVVLRLHPPRKSRSGTILQGTGEQKAVELLNFLRGKALL